MTGCKDETKEHVGEYASLGYLIDGWKCSCGWVSAPYFDGDAYAEAEHRKHAQGHRAMGDALSPPER